MFIVLEKKYLVKFIAYYCDHAYEKVMCGMLRHIDVMMPRCVCSKNHTCRVQMAAAIVPTAKVAKFSSCESLKRVRVFSSFCSNCSSSFSFLANMMLVVVVVGDLEVASCDACYLCQCCIVFYDLKH